MPSLRNRVKHYPVIAVTDKYSVKWLLEYNARNFLMNARGYKVIYLNLTFRGPCIVIYILIIKPTRCTNFSNYFWNRTLYFLDRFSVHHQESSTVYTAIGICHTGYVGCLLARSR